MPDYGKRFKPENQADGCCDFCCVPCDDAKCIQDGTCTCRSRDFLSYFCGETNNVGRDYKNMVSTIKERLNQIGTKDVDYKIAGFAWFQGWSDASKSTDWIEDECN
jgi:hypothetical protein